MMYYTIFTQYPKSHKCLEFTLFLSSGDTQPKTTKKNATSF